MDLFYPLYTVYQLVIQKLQIMKREKLIDFIEVMKT